MGLLALLLSAVLFVPQPGGEVQASRTPAGMEASASVGYEAGCIPERWCDPCPGETPESPCSPDDGCCASCISVDKRLASAPAIPGPAQGPATAGTPQPPPHVGGDHDGSVWHPPRG